ncbi:MAG: DUF349 domain-containing protein [Flavobacteriaceae bacterium]|nr:DUF349 domain-containing protein [Flavobacteriaceae bacterium]
MSDKELQNEKEKEPDNPTSEAQTVASEEKSETPKEEVKEADSVEESTAKEVKSESPEEVVEPKETTSETDTTEDIEEEQDEVDSSEDSDEDEDASEEEIDFHALSKEELIEQFRSLLKSKPIQALKQVAEEIRTEFNAKFSEELEQKKQEFLAGGGNIIDFHYTTPLKKQFNSLYFDYKEKRGNYYKNLKRDLQANYAKREELIEELKGLLNAEENINTTYKHFKDIQERWHVAGPIPRDKYNTIWNTYRHHVENFYDFLHLNREFRDLDFKHNLEQKLKLIGRAEELGQQEDVGKAFRELQMLHKMWKEEIGPVAKEYRDEVWDKFSAATKVIHDKRHDFIKEQEKHFEANVDLKNEIIAKINEISEKTAPTHRAWQNAIKEVQKLRDQYFELGKVPRNKAKEIWNSFKESTRKFNREKNGFYKNQKKEQYTNLEKKLELIKIAEENKDSDDFEVVTPLMKKIQSDWKSIGHVPRKDSDKIWKQFKDACNHYFNRVHAERNEANKEETAHLEAKQKMLDEMASLKLSGEHKTDLETIKSKIAEWKEIGRVPYNKRNIERKFNKVLDELFGKLNLGKKETEMIRFENKLNSLASQEDQRKLQNEEFFISKKINETRDAMRQLENNLGFFQNAKDDNPLVKEVHQNIAKHKEQLDVWKAKLTKIRSLRKGEV